jgi:hypothetical protein
MPCCGAVITGCDSSAIETVLAALEAFERLAVLIQVANDADLSIIQSQRDILLGLFVVVGILAKRPCADTLKVFADAFGKTELLGVGATDAV